MATNSSLEYANQNLRKINIIKPGDLVLVKKDNKSVEGYSDKLILEYAPSKSGYPFLVESVNEAAGNCVLRDELVEEGKPLDRITTTGDTSRWDGPSSHLYKSFGQVRLVHILTNIIITLKEIFSETSQTSDST